MKMQIILGFLVIIAASIGIYSANKLGNDNPVEEMAEMFIKEETGVSVDLTPESEDE